jgi:hypothetical protein
MRRTVLALLVVLGGCQNASPPHEAVLSWVPTAMRITGLVAPASNDPNTACLIAGASLEATIHVSRAPVTVILVAFTPTPATVPSFELRVGDRLVATDAIPTVAPKVLAYNVSPERGEHVLRVGTPGNSPGVLCIQSVALTQR